MDVRNVKVVARNLKRFVLRVKVPKQIARFHFQETARTAVASTVFLLPVLPAEATMVHSTTFLLLKTVFFGGVPQSTMAIRRRHPMSGCLIAVTPFSVAIAKWEMGIQFVASGINLTLSSPPEHLRRWSEGCTFS